MSFKARFTSFNWHNAEDDSLPKKNSTSVGSGAMVTSVEIEGGGEGCLNRFKILLQSLTLTLQVYWGGGDLRPLRTGTLVARGGATSPYMLRTAVASPAWRTRSSWSAGGNSKWSRGRAEPASSPPRPPPLPGGGWRLLPPLPPLPEVVTWALAEPPGCCLGGGLSECEEGAAKSEISIVTQDAPGAELERAREEGAPARPPAVLGAPQPPRAVPGPASLSQLGSD